MSWSLSVANLDATRSEEDHEVDGQKTKKVVTLCDRLQAHADAEFEKNPPLPHFADAQATQVKLAVSLVCDAVTKLGKADRVSVNIHGHANWNGKGPGQSIGFTVTLD